MTYNVAVIGATGVVGSMVLHLLAEKEFPINELRLFASERSAGREISFNDKIYEVEELNKDSFKNVDFAFFCAGSNIALEWVPIALESGSIVIDNSKVFRMNEDSSLIVPEINMNDFKGKGYVISNPNCSTIQSVIPLNALKKYGLKRVIYTTYQAVSGSGFKGIKEYYDTLNGLRESFYPYNINKTCIPQVDEFLDNGYTKEEMKMVDETKKILHLPYLNICATCVRVPVLNSHAVSVLVELEKDFEVNEIIEDFKNQPGLVVLDEPMKSIYPTSIASNGNDIVYVGRIRKDLSHPSSLLFYCAADNIRKGAASNAVMIAKRIIEDGMLK